MGQGWMVDPITGDYVMSGGSPVQSNSLVLPAYYRLKTKRTKWLYAPDNEYGSDYYTVLKRPASNSNTKLENIGAVALQPLVDDGRAKSVELTVTQNTRGGTELKTAIVDASGEIQTFVFNGLGV